MMTVVDLGLYALLFFAVACGFFLGRRYSRGQESPARSQHYYRGLNYLLNEQADSAVDKFIETLEVTPDTLETHLALGNMMRRKGEVDRAIKVHQNLIARPGLNTGQLHIAQLELARDFIKAGLLDRAEGLLQELVEMASALKVTCLELLVDIYRDEREWEKAIHAVTLIVGHRWKKVPAKWGVIQAHFCCELAELALAQNDFLSARRYLKQGLAYDKNSVRASLLWGGLECRLSRYNEALKILNRVGAQDSDYIPEIIGLICECYDALGDQVGLVQHLQKILEEFPSNSLVLAVADRLGQMEGDLIAAEFIGSELKLRPSIKGLSRLLELHLEHAVGGAKENLSILKQLVDQLLGLRFAYSCHRCGFKGNDLHWLCPSCKSWSSIKPIRGIEGE